MQLTRVIGALLVAGALPADISTCACDPEKPETLTVRQCSLCVEAEKQPAGIAVFFLKDANPSKPNRWLALPRVHGPGGHPLSGLTAEQRTELFQAAIEKAQSLWGDGWGIAYNGDEKRTQCHAHLHIGKLLDGNENDNAVTIGSVAEIPAPERTGLWMHPLGKQLHVHLGEQVNETRLMR